MTEGCIPISTLPPHHLLYFHSSLVRLYSATLSHTFHSPHSRRATKNSRSEATMNLEVLGGVLGVVKAFYYVG